jgi:hypothetical protein
MRARRLLLGSRGTGHSSGLEVGFAVAQDVDSTDEKECDDDEAEDC